MPSAPEETCGTPLLRARIDGTATALKADPSPRAVMPTLHEESAGVESEIGATSGDSHDDILVRQLGRERGLDLAIRDGPPPVRRA